MFRRAAILLTIVLAFGGTLAPDDAFARAAIGTSLGSRGTRTYTAPPSTSTAPGGAQSMQRSLTQPSAPATGGYGGYSGFGGRSSFMSGMMGGLLGAGIGGLLFGHGMFGGIRGFGGLFGLLIQIALVVWLGRMLWRMLARRWQPLAAGPMMYAPPMGGSVGMAGGGATLAIAAPDYHEFEELLHGVQAAWSAHDLRGLSQMASPEMVSYFAEQMSEQTSRGVVNTVTDVHLDKGDLAEAWSEPGRDYATVAMRFSMVDVTRDTGGRVVDGDPAQRVQATELWTFLRAPGGHWVLSAIQQAR
jgi:predicted lipid-binding transport protein (Tim44 family)